MCVLTALKNESLSHTFGDPEESLTRYMKHLVAPLVKAVVAPHEQVFPIPAMSISSQPAIRRLLDAKVVSED